MAVTAPTTKQQAYDHPAYEVPVFIGGQTTAGNSASARFAAFTAMVLKSCTITMMAAGTNTNTLSIIRVSAAGTATTTLGYAIWGTGSSASTALATTSGASCSFSLGTSTVAVGDIISPYSGLDATGTCAFGIEAYVVPGANLTV